MTSRKFRNTILTTLAFGALALPLGASAGVTAGAETDRGLLNATPQAEHNESAEMLYTRLQDISRDVCGSSNVRMTGDLRRAALNEECYEGTLTAAVNRLDDPEVSQLHSN